MSEEKRTSSCKARVEWRQIRSTKENPEDYFCSEILTHPVRQFDLNQTNQTSNLRFDEQTCTYSLNSNAGSKSCSYKHDVSSGALWILCNLQAVSQVLKGSGLVINGDREHNYSPTNSDSPATKGCERK